MRNPLYHALIRRTPRTPHTAPTLSAITPVFKSLEPVVHAEPTEICLGTQPSASLPRATSAKSPATLLGAIVAAAYCALAAPGLAAEASKTAADRASPAPPSQHAIAMHGEPKLPEGFTHFPYVNPDAPKGGRLTLGELGTFDSLNPFIVRGVAPAGLRGLVYESLLARSADEPFTLYAHIAESLRVAPGRSWIEFDLDPRATFSDGRSITVTDVLFSYEVLRLKGRPYLRSHYGKVTKAEPKGERTVRFTFSNLADREIPLIIALMPILPKHAVSRETFDQTTLETPVGSGPYVVSEIDPGRSLTLTRDAGYWAADHPVRRGMNNFDELKILYFRDQTALFEAFKTGLVDVRPENDPSRWVEGYDFPAIRSGRARQLTFETGKPAGMSGLVFNTRRTKFSDQRMREALLLAFDGETINSSLYHGRFVRTESFFARSYLASTGQPADARERRYLAQFANLIKPEIMDGTWRLPKVNSPQDARSNLREAFRLLTAAGYRLDGRRLVSATTGEQLSIEFLVTTNGQQRLALTFANALKRLGIAVLVRKIEASQYWSRIGRFDFDIIQWHYSASLSPGNEQINRWASSHADIERSLNYAGVRNPAVDRTIEAMLQATTRSEFVSAVRAFDRALLSGTYLIPLFHIPEDWYAAWADLRQPPASPLLGTDLMTWWRAPEQ